MREKNVILAMTEQIEGCDVALEIGDVLDGGLRARVTTDGGAVLSLYLAERHGKAACKAVDLIAGEVLVEMLDEIKGRVNDRLRQRRMDAITILRNAVKMIDDSENAA